MPYIALEIPLIDQVPAIAAAAKQPEAVVGWGLTRLYRYCWGSKRAEASRRVIEGYVPGLVEVGVEFELLRQTGPDTFEIAGLKRYLRTQDAQREAARKVNEFRWQREGTEKVQDRVAERVGERVAERPENDKSVPNGSLSGSVSDGKIEDRRSRSTDPSYEGSAQQLLIEPDQQPPGKKPRQPRQPSHQEEIWAAMCLFRTQKLEALGEPDTTPEAIPPAMINAGIKRLLTRLKELDEDADEGDVWALWSRYLEDSYGKSRQPMFALAPFLDERVWGRIHRDMFTSRDPLHPSHYQ